VLGVWTFSGTAQFLKGVEGGIQAPENVLWVERGGVGGGIIMAVYWNNMS